MRKCALILMALVLITPALAQRRMGGGGRPVMGPMRGGHSLARPGFHGRPFFHSRPFFQQNFSAPRRAVYPYFFGGYPYYSYPYFGGGFSPAYYPSAPLVTVIESAPAAPVVISVPPPPPPARSYIREVSPEREPLYLIAFRDESIQAAVAYWVDGETLHYVTREKKQKTAPLADVDREFSTQLNRERGWAFRLPR